MKKIIFNKINDLFKFISSDNGIMFILALIALCIFCLLMPDSTEISLTATTIVTGSAGGKHIIDGPVTTSLSETTSPGLLRNEIDDRIVKIRPMSTPIDQLSRWAGSRACGSMIVDYYAVDTRPTETTLAVQYDENPADGANGYQIATIYTENDAIFDASETILVPEVQGYDSEGNYNGALVLYIVSKGETEGLNVIAVNGKRSGGYINVIPTIPEGAKLIRMGRAAAELDVQTPQFEAMPTKKQNFCQIFKAQVEQSTFQSIANKEVGWSFSDQEEVAIIDMRLGMEKNFLFGSRARVYDATKRSEVFVTGGIWQQAGKEFSYDKGAFDSSSLVSLSRNAFIGNAGSSRKILIGGSGLIETLNKMEYTKVISAGDKVTRWGIDFNELRTKFGTLYVIHSEVFDQCGHSDDGFILDPEYITKYCHVPFRTETLDLKKSGVRNTDAIVITEASCLVLRYPQAHMRIVANS